MSNNNKRRHMRKEDARKITFSVIDHPSRSHESHGIERTGVLIDASTVGIGFVTDVPLEIGSLIRFYLAGIRHSGIVMWRLNADNEFRVGVRIIGEQHRSS